MVQFIILQVRADHGMILSWDSFTWGKEDSAYVRHYVYDALPYFFHENQ